MLFLLAVAVKECGQTVCSTVEHHRTMPELRPPVAGQDGNRANALGEDVVEPVKCRVRRK
jgi:hypothetical protein